MKRTEEYNLVSIIELPTGEAAGLGLLPAALPEALLGAHGEETVPVVFVKLVSVVVVMVARGAGLIAAVERQ